MSFRPARLLMLCCLTLAAAAAFVRLSAAPQETRPPAEPAQAAEIARLIRQLGDDQFDKREEACKRLEEIGEPALPPLRQALDSKDAEVRQRAERVLAAIAKRVFREVGRLEGHTLQVNCLALSADGKRLLTGCLDATLRLWDVSLDEKGALKTGKELRTFKDQPGGVWCVDLSADGKRALSSAGMAEKDGQWVFGTDFSILLWDLESGKVVRKLEGHSREVRSVVFSPDGKQALSAGWDKEPRLWDLETGKEIRRFEGHADGVRRAVFSPDGRRALSAGKDGTVRLWEVATGKEVRRFEGHAADVMAVAFTPDGRRALSGGADMMVRLWDLETGKEVRRFEGHSTVIWSVAVAPDGRRALSAGGCRPRGNGFYVPAGVDQEVRLWDVETGKEIYGLEGHTSSVMSVLFLPGGRRALSGGSDKTVRLWSVAGGGKE
jgi:WD40 repeat protein